jgi:transcriptional regulator with GAF, ATPase, and Fis domain
MDYCHANSVKHGQHAKSKILNNRIVYEYDLTECLHRVIISLESYKNHKDILKEVPQVLVKHFSARSCWINIFDDDRACNTYSSSVNNTDRYRDIINKEHRDRINEQVMQQGNTIQVKVNYRTGKLSECNAIEEEIIVLISPLRVSNTTLGLIFLVVGKNSQQRVLDILTLLKGISIVIGQSVYASRLQKILDSKLLKIASKSCESSYLHKEIPASDDRLNRMACIVAKTLFNEMCKAGFGKKQIINIVTEILSELQSHLKI